MKHKLSLALPAAVLAVSTLFGCSPAEYTVTYTDSASGQDPATPDRHLRPDPAGCPRPHPGGLQLPGLVPGRHPEHPLGHRRGQGQERSDPLRRLGPGTPGDTITDTANDKDFSSLTTPGSQESAYQYSSFFLPAPDGIDQPYVGDPMPYYEDGTYYIYYLKDGGDSYNHSVYLATHHRLCHLHRVRRPHPGGLPLRRAGRLGRHRLGGEGEGQILLLLHRPHRRRQHGVRREDPGGGGRQPPGL